MNAVAAPKSHRMNQLEGITLTAFFQAFPTFAATVLLLKLAEAKSGSTGFDQPLIRQRRWQNELVAGESTK